MLEFVGKRPGAASKNANRTVTRHFSISLSASNYLDQQSVKDIRFSASRFISDLIDGIEKEETENVGMVSHSLVKCEACGAEYSDIYTKCVVCEGMAIKEQTEKAKLAEAVLAANISAADEQKTINRVMETERRLKLNPELFKELKTLYENTPREQRLIDGVYSNIVDKYYELKIVVGTKNIIEYFEWNVV